LSKRIAYTPKEHAKDLRLQREFHITLIEFRLILKEQKGCCGICKRPMNFLNKKGKPTFDFAVDHCHRSGLVRGLLCMECNRALGKWRDIDERVVAAGEYVKSPPAILALGRRHLTAVGRVGTAVRSKLLAAMKGNSGLKRK
jgi:hypothetical protein